MVQKRKCTMSVFKPQLTGNEVLLTSTKQNITKQTFLLWFGPRRANCRCDITRTVYSKRGQNPTCSAANSPLLAEYNERNYIYIFYIRTADAISKKGTACGSRAITAHTDDTACSQRDGEAADLDNHLTHCLDSTDLLWEMSTLHFFPLCGPKIIVCQR